MGSNPIPCTQPSQLLYSRERCLLTTQTLMTNTTPNDQGSEIRQFSKAIIEQYGAQLNYLLEQENIEEFEAETMLTESFIDKFRSASFVETMLFAKMLCDNYSVDNSFPAEQRTDYLIDTDDWREAATGGLYHIVMEAISKEATSQRDADNDPNINRDPLREHLLDEHLNEYSEIETTNGSDYNQLSASLWDPLDWDKDEIVTLAEDLLHVTETDDGESESLPDEVQSLLDEDFKTKLLVMDYVAEEYEFTSYEGMSDTATRDSYASDFCNVIDKMITEFFYFYE